MFDQLFRYPAVLRRHRDGPLAHERATYLTSLTARGSAPGTLLKCARYCLAIAHVLQTRPLDQSFTTPEIDALAREWAAGRVQHRRAAAPRWPHEQFLAVATGFLKFLSRWTPPSKASRPYACEVDDFVTAEQRDRALYFRPLSHPSASISPGIVQESPRRRPRRRDNRHEGRRLAALEGIGDGGKNLPVHESDYRGSARSKGSDTGRGRLPLQASAAGPLSTVRRAAVRRVCAHRGDWF